MYVSRNDASVRNRMGEHVLNQATTHAHPKSLPASLPTYHSQSFIESNRVVAWYIAQIIAVCIYKRLRMTLHFKIVSLPLMSLCIVKIIYSRHNICGTPIPLLWFYTKIVCPPPKCAFQNMKQKSLSRSPISRGVYRYILVWRIPFCRPVRLVYLIPQIRMYTSTRIYEKAVNHIIRKQ